MNVKPVKYRKIRGGDKTRCVNPHCGKWVELYQEKFCPRCEKRTVDRADRQRCPNCSTMLQSGDMVCPLCGSKQRTTVELRSVPKENLTACSHLLQEAQPSLSLTESRSLCREIREENPYRVSFASHPEKIHPFLQRWEQLGGKAAACLARETSRRPVVLLRSYNRLRQNEHARLLFEAVQKTDLSSLSFGETVSLLYGINREEKPVRLVFTSGFDQIEAWIAAWRKLGGTAVRSSEHLTADRDGRRHSRTGNDPHLFFRETDPEL